MLSTLGSGRKKIMSKKCLNCGKELVGKQRKYCSIVCGNKKWAIDNVEPPPP